MRLINCLTLELEEFFGSNIPPYAILSHTWGNDEVTFLDLPLYTPATQARAGYQKIEFTCKQAISDNLEYAWVDTCCIDNRSSSELSEAINSMFAWYRVARRCYAYLSDVLEEGMDEQFRTSRWFTRCWTLQELLAPIDVIFYNCNWHRLGRRSDHSELISGITGIDVDALRGRSARNYDNGDPFGAHCVAKRMSWASQRDTTRTEDMTYCLLGIFNINMLLLYGEGDRAFHRLQEEIIQRVNDDSILAWEPRLDIKGYTEPILDVLRVATSYDNIGQNILAKSPKDFTSCGDLKRAENPVFPITLTSLGLNIQLPLLFISQEIFRRNLILFSKFVGLLSCSVGEEGHFVGIFITAVGPNQESAAETTRTLARDNTGYYSTVILSARDALRTHDRTITMQKFPRRYHVLQDLPSHTEIVVEKSATLWEMGYQLIKPTHWNECRWERSLIKQISTWYPDEMILRTKSDEMFSPLTELSFENIYDPSFSKFTVFLCHKNSNAVVMKGETFSGSDRLMFFSSLLHNASQSDYEDVTIQSEAEHMYRVGVEVRKMTVRGRIIFELRLTAVLVSASSASDVISRICVWHKKLTK